MTKYLLAIITALICIVWLAAPVLATDPPIDATANASQMIIYYGENLTIDHISGEFTITITDLENILRDAMESQTDAMVLGNTALLEYAVMFVLILAIIAFGYWGKDKWLLMLSGFGLVAFAFMLWDWISIVAVIAGIYLVIKAFNDRRLNRE
jgi:small-conductance mechanosensitive channel